MAITTGAERAGLVVDQIIGSHQTVIKRLSRLHRTAATFAEAPPMVGLRWRRDYVRELVRRPEGVVVLPDLAVIFRSLLGGGEPAATHSTIC